MTDDCPTCIVAREMRLLPPSLRPRAGATLALAHAALRGAETIAGALCSDCRRLYDQWASAMLRLSVALLLALVGCARAPAPPPHPVHVDAQELPDYRAPCRYEYAYCARNDGDAKACSAVFSTCVGSK